MDASLNTPGRPSGVVGTNEAAPNPYTTKNAPHVPRSNGFNGTNAINGSHGSTNSNGANSTSTNYYKVKDLLAKVQLEEKIRDGAENMLQDLELMATQQQSKYKVKTSTSSDSLAHRKRVIAQVEASETRIEVLKNELRQLGHDTDALQMEDIDLDDGQESDDSLMVDSTRPSQDDSRKAESYDPEDSSTAHSMAKLPHANLSNTSFLPADISNATVHTEAVTLETSGRYFVKLFTSLDPSKPVASEFRTVDKLGELFQLFPVLRGEVAIDQACDKIKGFFIQGSTQHYILGYRLCRLLAVDKIAFTTIRLQLHTDWLVVQSLAREDSSTFHNERLEALHFVRLCLQYEDVDLALVRSVVAVTEQQSDKLRHIGLETLAELIVIDPVLAIEGGALKILLNVLLEGPAPVAVCITRALLHILDDPHLRHLLRDGKDLSVVLTVFTDVQLYGTASPSNERLHTAASVIKTILRSWQGLYAFDIPMLIDCMTVPTRNVQICLLDILRHSLTILEDEVSQGKSGWGGCYSNHFTSLLLEKLLNAGLRTQLALLQSEEYHAEVRKKAHFLNTSVILLSSRLLPLRLLDHDPPIPFPADAPVYGLPTAVIPLFNVTESLQMGSSQSGETSSNLRDSETFIRMGSQIDDASFKQLLSSTHVLDTKLYRQWNWDALLELIQGPMRNPKRLDEALRGSKFMKRLLSFYRPFKYRFSNLHVSKDHLRYVKVGKELISSLLDTSEGSRYLSGNKLLRQIAECLAQLDPDSGITSTEPLFSPRRFKSTLCYAYFEMIGILSRSPTGQQIMASLRIFNMLHRIVGTGRDDLTRAIIHSLDYGLPGHPRLIMSKALTSCSKQIRIFATRYLQELTSDSSTKQNWDMQRWMIDQLVGQLYDVDMNVCQAAVNALVACCRHDSNLDHFISLKPFLSHLGDSATSLSMFFLSRPAGFKLVQQINKDYVSTEMDGWVHGLNDEYADKMEEFLEMENEYSEANARKISENPSKMPTYPSVKDILDPPRHFFGELVLTDQGCSLLKKCDHVKELAKYVACNKLATDEESIRRIKGCLWALGHISSRPLGAELMNLTIVGDIADVFSQSPIYSVRGAAFYTLGLISRSLEGAELLWQCGWAVTYDNFGRSRGISLPDTSSAAMESKHMPTAITTIRLGSLNEENSPQESNATSDDAATSVFKASNDSTIISVAANDNTLPIEHAVAQMTAGDFNFSPPQPPPSLTLGHALSSRSIASQTSSTSLASGSSSVVEFPKVKDSVAEQALRVISDLSNYVLAHDASKRLVALRAAHPPLFQNPDVFRDMMKVLQDGHYKQLVRRFLFELFDVRSVLERSYKRRRGSRLG